MPLNLQQRSVASGRRVGKGRSHDDAQDALLGALAMPSDADHRISKRFAADRQKGTVITRNDTLVHRTASLEATNQGVLAASTNSANVIAVAELLARVEELLRPSNENRETVLKVGPLQLDLLTRRVQRDKRMIDLRPREFCLLEYMMRRRGQVLTRAMLFMEVWNYKFTPQSNLVDVHMGRLRNKIDAKHEPPMIFNVRGQGFVLRAPD